MTDLDRRMILPDNCHWCGHLPHNQPCQGAIATKTGDKPCPCTRHERLI